MLSSYSLVRSIACNSASPAGSSKVPPATVSAARGARPDVAPPTLPPTTLPASDLNAGPARPGLPESHSPPNEASRARVVSQ